MFIPVAFDSVNAESDLPAGVYSTACGVYRSPDGKSQITLFEYSLQGVDSVVAADLLVLDSTGAIRACDFVWLADRSWRDSSGLKANHLAELLPQELLSYALVRSEALGELTVASSSSVATFESIASVSAEQAGQAEIAL